MAGEFCAALDAANKAIESAFFAAGTSEECQQLARKLELYSDCLASRGAALLDFLEMISDEKREKLVAFFEQSSSDTFDIKQDAESGKISQHEGKLRLLNQIELMKREVEQVETLETHPSNRITQFFNEGE